jgi:DNA-binding MltR family transcriptional regulator
LTLAFAKVSKSQNYIDFNQFLELIQVLDTDSKKKSGDDDYKIELNLRFIVASITPKESLNECNQMKKAATLLGSEQVVSNLRKTLVPLFCALCNFEGQ